MRAANIQFEGECICAANCGAYRGVIFESMVNENRWAIGGRRFDIGYRFGEVLVGSVSALKICRNTLLASKSVFLAGTPKSTV